MPAFRGGILTERVEELVPPEFRRRLPERVVDSGRIFREIVGLEDVFQTKGSGASPEMLRTEMGVMYGFDLHRALSTQLVELDAVQVTAAPPAANTTTPAVFSFPQLPSGGPAGAHRILGMMVSLASSANFEGARLLVRPFGDPTAATVGFIQQAQLTTIAGMGIFGELIGPAGQGQSWWGERDVDYEWIVRSNAGGATSAILHLVVAMVPPGVAVPK